MRNDTLRDKLKDIKGRANALSHSDEDRDPRAEEPDTPEVGEQTQAGLEAEDAERQMRAFEQSYGNLAT